MPAIEIASATVTAAATATAKMAFDYTRENYMFDQGLRFQRFNVGYSMAMAQTAQYREDISDMTELTVTKADAYHTVGTICFVLNFQLIMAGRLGVHGPAPPGWIMGLYWTNICSALMFLVTFTWLAMHSGARATAGAVYMRTRTVRLPIPTPDMLDKARTTGNSFEKQRLADMFRIPFVMPAGKETAHDEEQGVHIFASDRRVPKWYKDEVRELRKDEGGAAPSPSSVPEHFELYRGLQEEWWAYDVYARIGILFFFSHWLTSVSLYSMCHVFTELRIVWPAWTVIAVFMTAHYGILKLDITSSPKEGSLMCIPMERIVPFTPLLCVLGMTIDYSVLTPTPFWQGFIYALSGVAYLIHFAWAIRLYDLASPQNRLKESPEFAGEAWSPMEWPVPPAFKQAVYLVSAPKYLEPGQSCLQQEMKAAKVQHGQTPKKARQVAPAMYPWKLFRGAIITMISMWVLIICGRFFEMINGERQLLKQEGRVERWPSHVQPWMAPWTRRGSRNEMCHSGGCDRRLSGQSEVSAVAQRLAVALRPLADVLDSRNNTVGIESAEQLVQAGFQLPSELKPVVLAAQGSLVAAFEKQGRGVLLGGAEPVAFNLEADHSIGEIHSVTWGEAALLLVAADLQVFECEGLPVAGKWGCRKVSVQALPQVRTAAVERRAGGGLRAAVAFEGDSHIVLLEEAHDGAWVPAGEVRSPVDADMEFELSFAANKDALLVATADGAVVQRNLAAVGSRKVAASVSKTSLVAWRGACSLGDGRVARVGSRDVYMTAVRQ